MERIFHKEWTTTKGNQIEISLEFASLSGHYRFMAVKNKTVFADLTFVDPNFFYPDNSRDCPKYSYENIRGESEHANLVQSMKRYLETFKEE